MSRSSGPLAKDPEPAPPAPAASPDLATLRARIDAVDDRLLALLDERLSIAVQMGRVKRRDNLPGRDVSREAAVVGRLCARATTDDETVRAVWSALFAASRRVQAADRDPPTTGD